jgi:hypothetical protein
VFPFPSPSRWLIRLVPGGGMIPLSVLIGSLVCVCYCADTHLQFPNASFVRSSEVRLEGEGAPHAPHFISQPEDLSVPHGGRAMFLAEVEGSAPLHFQWQKDGLALPGETNKTLVLYPVLPAHQGCYRLIASNYVAVPSDAACLEVVRIVGFDLPTLANGLPTLSMATDLGRSYRIVASTDLRVWEELTNFLATVDHFVLSDPEPNHWPHRFYWLWAGDVPAPVRILQQPVGGSAIEGGEFTFSVLAEGSSPLEYVWQFGEAPLAGETNAVLVLPNLRATQAGVYRVIVRNPLGEVTSADALLEVRPAGTSPRITRQPVGGSAALGTSFAFSVEAEGTAPLRYQWQRNRFDIPGATSATYVIARVTAASFASYRVIVSNDAGSVESVDVELEIDDGGYD